MQIEVNDARAMGLLEANKRALPFFAIVGHGKSHVVLEADDDDAADIVEFLDGHGVESELEEGMPSMRPHSFGRKA
jgi:hypothetical protein